MGKLIDLTGQKYGRLTVIKRAEEKCKQGESSKWVCQCDCGNIIIVKSNRLRTGNTKSCGCYKIETCSKNGKANRKRRKKFNVFITQGEITKIYDDKDNECIIDTEDIDKVKQHYWSKDVNGYWISSENVDGIRTIYRLHTYLLETNPVDHIDRNKSNNSKQNLRPTTIELNNKNRTKSRNNTSGITGVYYHKKRQAWKATVSMKPTKNHKSTERFLGWYKTKEEAIRARLLGELKYYGIEYAPQRHLFEEYGIW